MILEGKFVLITMGTLSPCLKVYLAVVARKPSILILLFEVGWFLFTSHSSTTVMLVLQILELLCGSVSAIHFRKIQNS